MEKFQWTISFGCTQTEREETQAQMVVWEPYVCNSDDKIILVQSLSLTTRVNYGDVQCGVCRRIKTWWSQTETARRSARRSSRNATCRHHRNPKRKHVNYRRPLVDETMLGLSNLDRLCVEENVRSQHNRCTDACLSKTYAAWASNVGGHRGCDTTE